MAERTLVCFALPDEAAPFRRQARGLESVDVLVTGMGSGNAAAAVARRWSRFQPQWVFTCGFAGGLDPGLASGEVVFAAGEGFPGRAVLLAAGARPAVFHCADRMAVTAAEKSRLRAQTGADAVEMESAAIQAVCAEAGVPCATVRVISDAAGEDLPLDFNRFTRPDYRLDFGRLLWAVVRTPAVVRPLLRLRRTTRAAALRLAAVLTEVIRAAG